MATTNSTLISMEVRWFRADKIFPLCGELKELEPMYEQREDMYILLPGATTVGAKLRDNNLEIKYLIKDFRIAKLSSNISGRISIWGKTGLSISTPYSLDNLITIRKERWLYGFGIDDEGRVQPAAFSKLPPLNGNIEFCRLTIGTENWWSLCLAVYGKKERLRECLKRGCDYVADSMNNLELTADQSLHFPQWLNLRPK